MYICHLPSDQENLTSRSICTFLSPVVIGSCYSHFLLKPWTVFKCIATRGQNVQIQIKRCISLPKMWRSLTFFSCVPSSRAVFLCKMLLIALFGQLTSTFTQFTPKCFTIYFWLFL
uniref:Uncharacterized protein n=1 Tax=Anguilla anguilla TaxID=7936 RepID=A0A0E9QCZ1_ANGAN